MRGGPESLSVNINWRLFVYNPINVKHDRDILILELGALLPYDQPE